MKFRHDFPFRFPRSILLCTWLLFRRQLICNSRNRLANVVRILSTLFIASLLGLLFTDVAGSVSTCPPTKHALWQLDMSNLLETLEYQRVHARENLSIIFIMVMVSLLVSMLKVVVTFPLEVFVFQREYNNFSYKLGSYFVAILVADVPFDLTTTTGFVALVYFWTGQLFDSWTRLALVVLPCYLITFIGQILGRFPRGFVLNSSR